MGWERLGWKDCVGARRREGEGEERGRRVSVVGTVWAGSPKIGH